MYTLGDIPEEFSYFYKIELSKEYNFVDTFFFFFEFSLVIHHSWGHIKREKCLFRTSLL